MSCPGKIGCPGKISCPRERKLTGIYPTILVKILSDFVPNCTNNSIKAHIAARHFYGLEKDNL